MRSQTLRTKDDRLEIPINEIFSESEGGNDEDGDGEDEV